MFMNDPCQNRYKYPIGINWFFLACFSNIWILVILPNQQSGFPSRLDPWLQPHTVDPRRCDDLQISPLLGSIEKAKHVPKEITEKTRHAVTKWVFQYFVSGHHESLVWHQPEAGPKIRVLMGPGRGSGQVWYLNLSSLKLMVLYIFKWLEMITLNFTPSERWNPWKNPLEMSGILAEHDDVAQFLIQSLGGVPRLANKWNCAKLYWLFSSRSVFTKTFARAHVTLSGQTIIQLLPLGRMGGFPSLKPEVLVLVGKSTTIPDSQGLLHCNLKSDKVNFAAKTLSQQNGRTVVSLAWQKPFKRVSEGMLQDKSLSP